MHIILFANFTSTACEKWKKTQINIELICFYCLRALGHIGCIECGSTGMGLTDGFIRIYFEAEHLIRVFFGILFMQLASENEGKRLMVISQRSDTYHNQEDIRQSESHSHIHVF